MTIATTTTERSGVYNAREIVAAAMKQLERTCIFIDNSNLFWALRSFGTERRLDYIKLRNFLANGRPTDVRFYYSQPTSASSDDALVRLEKQKNFYAFLEKVAGYTMVKLPLRDGYISEDGEITASEKGLDCEIVFDMCKLSITGHYKTFVLVAGDQDYARTVSRIRETGVNIEVAFFRSNATGPRTSPLLIQSASSFIDLNEVRDKLFMDKYQLSNTG